MNVVDTNTVLGGPVQEVARAQTCPLVGYPAATEACVGSGGGTPPSASAGMVGT
jgi:hypothetical protein